MSTAVDDGDPAAVVVPGADANPVGITVTNSFDVGDLVVRKTLSGDGAPDHQNDVFTVSLECTVVVDGEQVPVAIPGGSERTVSAAGGWTATYEDLPQGATCVVSETDAGTADSVEILVGDESTTTDPSAAVPASAEFQLPMGDDASYQAEVINTWPASPDSGGQLPRTGTHMLLLVGLATLLTIVGVALAAYRRRYVV